MARASHSSTGRLLRPLTVAGLLVACSVAPAKEVRGYGFEAAAQEVSQLFWLAETAHLCRWATQDDTDRFKLFSVRFLSAHLSERNRLALLSMVTENGYGNAVRQAAAEGVEQNCSSSRWRIGSSSYRSAAGEHENEF